MLLVPASQHTTTKHAPTRAIKPRRECWLAGQKLGGVFNLMGRPDGSTGRCERTKPGANRGQTTVAQTKASGLCVKRPGLGTDTKQGAARAHGRSRLYGNGRASLNPWGVGGRALTSARLPATIRGLKMLERTLERVAAAIDEAQKLLGHIEGRDALTALQKVAYAGQLVEQAQRECEAEQSAGDVDPAAGIIAGHGIRELVELYNSENQHGLKLEIVDAIRQICGGG